MNCHPVVLLQGHGLAHTLPPLHTSGYLALTQLRHISEQPRPFISLKRTPKHHVHARPLPGVPFGRLPADATVGCSSAPRSRLLSKRPARRPSRLGGDAGNAKPQREAGNICTHLAHPGLLRAHQRAWPRPTAQRPCKEPGTARMDFPSPANRCRV